MKISFIALMANTHYHFASLRIAIGTNPEMRLKESFQTGLTNKGRPIATVDGNHSTG